MNRAMLPWLWTGLALVIVLPAIAVLCHLQGWSFAARALGQVTALVLGGGGVAFLVAFHQQPWVGRFGFWIGVLAGGGAAAVMAHAAGAEDLGYTLGAATALFLAADLGLRAMRWVFRAGHPVLGVAGAVLDEAIRRNLVRWMIAILVVVVAALAVIGDVHERLDYRERFFLSWSLMASTGLLGILTLALGCSSVASEYAGKQLHMTLVKPVSRFGYLLGKWLGVMSVNLVLLALVAGSVWGGSELIMYRHARRHAADPERVQRDRDAVLRDVLVARTPRPATDERSDTFDANFMDGLRASIGNRALSPSSNLEQVNRVMDEAARAGRAATPADVKPYLAMSDWLDLRELALNRWLTLGTPKGGEATEPSQTYVFHGLEAAAARGRAARERALRSVMRETNLSEGDAQVLLHYLLGRVREDRLVGAVGKAMQEILADKRKWQAMRAIRAEALSDRLQLRLTPQAAGALPRPGYIELRLEAGGAPLPPVTIAEQQLLDNAGVPAPAVALGSRLLAPEQSNTLDIPCERIDEGGRLVVRLTRPLALFVVAGPDGRPALQGRAQPTITFEIADGMTLFSKDGGFAPNLGRAVGVLGCKLALLAMLAVVASALFSFPIAVLLSATLFGIFSLSGWLHVAVEEYVTIKPSEDALGKVMDARHDVIRFFSGWVLRVLPDFGRFESTEKVVDGVVVRWSLLGHAAFTLGLWTLGVFGVGGWLFHRREIARVVV